MSTVEERLAKLEADNTALAIKVNQLESNQANHGSRINKLETLAREAKEIYETLSQTVSCAVGDMQESVNNTLSHVMQSVDARVDKALAKWKEGKEG